MLWPLEKYVLYNINVQHNFMVIVTILHLEELVAYLYEFIQFHLFPNYMTNIVVSNVTQYTF